MEFKVTQCIATLEGLFNCGVIYDSDDFSPELIEELQATGYLEDLSYMAEAVGETLTIGDLADVKPDICNPNHGDHVLRISEDGTQVTCGKVVASKMDNDLGFMTEADCDRKYVVTSMLGNFVTYDDAQRTFVTDEKAQDIATEVVNQRKAWDTGVCSATTIDEIVTYLNVLHVALQEAGLMEK